MSSQGHHFSFVKIVQLMQSNLGLTELHLQSHLRDHWMAIYPLEI
jgi:hypothetical protein